MLAMIIAAAAVASAQPSPSLAASVFKDPSPFAATAACKATGRYQTDWEPALLYRQQDRLGAKRLGDLPKPDYEKTVMRTVEGCSAPLVVGSSVGR
jgi:hypothetical protein